MNYTDSEIVKTFVRQAINAIRLTPEYKAMLKMQKRDIQNYIVPRVIFMFQDKLTQQIGEEKYASARE